MMPSLLSLVTAAALLVEGVVSQQTPTVKVKNGTLEGRYLPGYNQDLFLGIPFAQPPVGQLRFQNPQSLNETFDTLKVKKYGDSCVGYGVSNRLWVLIKNCILTLTRTLPTRALLPSARTVSP